MLTVQDAQLRATQIDDISYNLFFDISAAPTSSSFTGIAKILFQWRESQKALRLDYTNGKVKALKINDSEIQNYDYNGFFLSIAPENFSRGKNTIEIHFETSFSDDGRGLYRFVDLKDNKVYLYSDFEPFDAHSLFPCADQPDLKATYETKVLAPKGWSVVSTVRESGVTPVEQGDLWHFPQSLPLSTYVWSLHAGEYHVWEDSSAAVPLRIFARQSFAMNIDTEEWFSVTKKGFEFFNSYFKYPYPYSKYDQLLVPDFNSGAMENVGAVTFSARYFSRGKMTRIEQMNFDITVLHEMTHMWFGNLVTMKWWDDLWLNESFADNLSFLALAKLNLFSPHEVWRSFYEGKRGAYDLDDSPITHPIQSGAVNTDEAFSNFDTITYEKGSSVIKQISFYIGEDNFQNAVANYIQKFQNKNAVFQDFIQALQESTEKDLHSWVSSWLQTQGVNTIEIEPLVIVQDNEKVLQGVRLVQSPKDALKPQKLRLAFLKKAGEGNEVVVHATKDVLLSGEDAQVLLDHPIAENLIIYPNYEDYGYAKFILDASSTDHVMQHLKDISDPFLRHMIWGTLFDMVVNTKLNPRRFLDIALKHLQENEDDLMIDFVGSRMIRCLFYLGDKAGSQATAVEEFFWQNLHGNNLNASKVKIWFKLYLAAAQTPAALQNLTDLLDRKSEIHLLFLDEDLRWEIIRILISFGFLSKEHLEEEKARDHSSQGKLFYLASLAAQNAPEVKEHYLNLLLNNQESWTLNEQRAVINGLFPRNQEHLRRQYAPLFFSHLALLLKEKDPVFFKSYLNIFPLCATPELEDFYKSFMEMHGETSVLVTKLLKKKMHDARICQQIRKLL